MKIPILYLIPNDLGKVNYNTIFPNENAIQIKNLKNFVVENPKTAYKFLKKMLPDTNLNQLEIYKLDKKTQANEWLDLIHLLDLKDDIGLFSEAGMPSVADPGSDFVRLAHDKNYRIRPLVGPSSIILALTASGLNGQNFRFSGYLPIREKEKEKSIISLEKESARSNSAQIFMEAPYRNHKLLESILKVCRNQTQLCIASNLTLANETIHTKTIGEWKSIKIERENQPTIFILQS